MSEHDARTCKDRECACNQHRPPMPFPEHSRRLRALPRPEARQPRTDVTPAPVSQADAPDVGEEEQA